MGPVSWLWKGELVRSGVYTYGLTLGTEARRTVVKTGSGGPSTSVVQGHRMGDIGVGTVGVGMGKGWVRRGLGSGRVR